MTVAYPRRKDAVFYEVFNGTVESAKLIAHLTKAEVRLSLSPDDKWFPHDTVTVDSVTVAGRVIKTGQAVVVKWSDDDVRTFEVLDRNELEDKYSKDGN